MKSDFFIDRPVFSTVLSVVIVIVGLLGLVMLPVDQYPRIVPPVVKISASYPGASAQTVTQAVATPIEQELNGTPGMLYMESTSSNSGGFSATVTFDIDTDADLAAVEIQNRVKQAEARLPAEVIQNGISVEKQASSRLMTITLLSNDPKFDEIYLSNYATLNVLDMLRRVKGVGSVSNVGSRYYAMQIWVQPDRLANLGLTVQDLQKALKDQNRESAAGVLGQQPVTDLDVTIPITARGRLSSVGEFEEIVVRANPDGSLIRLRDVARISLEASSYSTESGINGGNAAVMNINMLPGANAMEVARSVRETMEEISRSFPEGISYKIPFDMTSYISQSIREVYHTLFEALLLVILVVFLSLQNWRATLIPTIAVPISLIGTFGVMLAFGFSLNMMTLLGLILAIGIVVDDAIVVVEAVERIMNEEGLSPYEATKKAMSGLGSAIIATSLVLCAVFVPVSFLSGITGQLYRQDLATGEQTVLFTIPEEDLNPPEVQWEGKDLWNYFVHDQPLEAPIPSAIWLLGVSEDTVTLAYRYPDGSTSDTLVLDSRTGEVRSRTRDLEDRWTSYVGDRAIETVVMPHTEGFTYPGWEDDAETNAYRWTDIRENGVSLLPPGTMEGQSDTAQDFRGGLLVGYCPRETLDENGNYLRYATGYLLLTADGATYDLPGPAQGEERTYHCAAGDWVYYSCRSWTATDTGGRRMTQQLRAQHLDTGEDVLIEDNLWGNQVVTDGTWCYLSDEITTTCCRLDWDGQGRPCGLTVVEKGL